jgi:hypothetical protein
MIFGWDCCSVENTIYNAQGGVNGHVNKQRIFLYPSPEDARAAVAEVVLNAFRNRGITVKFESSRNRCHHATFDDVGKSNLNEPVFVSRRIESWQPFECKFYYENGCE